MSDIGRKTPLKRSEEEEKTGRVWLAGGTHSFAPSRPVEYDNRGWTITVTVVPKESNRQV